MTKDQAAKLAKAYQWLAEGKKVESRYTDEEWRPWDGWDRDCREYRIKPESIVGFWAVLTQRGSVIRYDSKGQALQAASDSPDVVSRVLYLCEVDKPAIQAMVERLRTWRIDITTPFNEYAAERLVRHILGIEEDVK